MRVFFQIILIILFTNIPAYHIRHDELNTIENEISLTRMKLGFAKPGNCKDKSSNMNNNQRKLSNALICGPTVEQQTVCTAAAQSCCNNSTDTCCSFAENDRTCCNNLCYQG